MRQKLLTGGDEDATKVPPIQPSSATRMGRVFPLRLTDQERQALERACKADAEARGSYRFSLGPYIVRAALAEARRFLAEATPHKGRAKRGR